MRDLEPGWFIFTMGIHVICKVVLMLKSGPGISRIMKFFNASRRHEALYVRLPETQEDQTGPLMCLKVCCLGFCLYQTSLYVMRITQCRSYFQLTLWRGIVSREAENKS